MPSAVSCKEQSSVRASSDNFMTDHLLCFQTPAAPGAGAKAASWHQIRSLALGILPDLFLELCRVLGGPMIAHELARLQRLGERLVKLRIADHAGRRSAFAGSLQQETFLREVAEIDITN